VTEQQARAALLLAGPARLGYLEVSARVGVSRRTLERWAAQPEFRAEVERLRGISRVERELADATFSPNPEVRAVAAAELSARERAGL